MPIKIQINSKEALERLLGDDSALQIEARNSVVQQFTKSHLKALVNDELIKKLGRELKAEIVEVKLGHHGKAVLREEVRALISNHVAETLQSVALSKSFSMVEEAINLINKKVQEKAGKIIEAVTSYEFEDRVSKEVERRLKALRDAL